MSKFFSEKIAEYVPLINKHIVEKRPEEFGVDDPDILPNIFSRTNRHKNISDHDKKIVYIASDVMAGIVFDQPFKNGNKSTAMVLTQHFLKVNGYVISSSITDDELVTLLESVSPLYLSEDEYDVAFTKVKTFLLESTVKIKKD